MDWPGKDASAQFRGWRSFTPAGQGKHVTQEDADYEYVCGAFLYRRMIASA